MKKIVFVAPLILMFIFITGCRPAKVVIKERPMEPHYAQPLAPGPNYIWHNGEWIRYGNTYVYHKGFWMKALSNHRHYIAGNWQRRRGGWVWMQEPWR